MHNLRTVAVSNAVAHALEILTAGHEALDPMKQVARTVSYDPRVSTMKIGHRYSVCTPESRVVIAGLGEDTIGVTTLLARLLAQKAVGHAVVRSAQDVRRLLPEPTSHDFVVCVIADDPATILAPYGLSDEQARALIKHLREAGASEEEVVAVRAHMSEFGNGRLAQSLAPSRLHVMYMSPQPQAARSLFEVSPATPRDVVGILNRYGGMAAVDMPAMRLLPSAAEPLEFHSVTEYDIASQQYAEAALKKSASHFGYSLVDVPVRVSPETLIRHIVPGQCFVGQGIEDGLSLLVALAPRIEGDASAAWLSSEGVAYYVDASTRIRARALGLDPEVFQSRDDLKAYFSALGDTAPIGLLPQGAGNLFAMVKM